MERRTELRLPRPR